jgi:hypothetical protein
MTLFRPRQPARRLPDTTTFVPSVMLPSLGRLGPDGKVRSSNLHISFLEV